MISHMGSASVFGIQVWHLDGNRPYQDELNTCFPVCLTCIKNFKRKKKKYRYTAQLYFRALPVVHVARRQRPCHTCVRNGITYNVVYTQMERADRPFNIHLCSCIINVGVQRKWNRNFSMSATVCACTLHVRAHCI